jgi:hypothetical protein
MAVVPVMAQVERATILGTVTDNSGSAVQAVAVTVRDIGTDERRTTKTNERGDYEVPALNIGTYEVSVEHPGFRRALVSGSELVVNQRARIDAQLQLGAVTQELTVQGAAQIQRGKRRADHDPRRRDSSAAGGGAVEVSGRFDSVVPVDRMELYMNGRAMETVRAGARRGELHKRVPVTRSGWLTFRAISDAPQHPVEAAHVVAETSPVDVYCGDEPLSCAGMRNTLSAGSMRWRGRRKRIPPGIPSRSAGTCSIRSPPRGISSSTG